MGELVLFPAHGLDQSILVAVLVGIWVLLFFTEVFGWVWAGLVVPGYLASVFVIQPGAGVAVAIEAVLTLLVCRALSDVLPRTGAWSPFFGRERFFLIVLVSVLVRQVSELWILPVGLAWVDGHLGTQLAAGQGLASIGLVLVPLLANMFWKLSVRAGLAQIGVTVGIVWVVLVFVLLPHTNLSFSNLELTYEDVALDFLGSPKAYILLLTGAFIAARYNLTYGWDYNGILVPSLLALTWLRPVTLVYSVVEALVLLYVTRAFLNLPMLRTQNLEGPRKVVVVFTVGFALKMLVGWIASAWLPWFHLSDVLGFGYVLTSLMAVKMLVTKKVGRVLLPTVQVSLVAFVLGSAIGFGLDVVLPAPPRPHPARAHAGATRLGREAAGVAAWATARALPARSRGRGAPSSSSRAAYDRLWRDVEAWTRGDGAAGTRVDGAAEALGFRLVPAAPTAGRTAWALIEATERLADVGGWDAAWIVPGAPGPALAVARPRSQPRAAAATAALCERLACRAILFGGVDGAVGGDADPRGERAPWRIAARRLGTGPLIEIVEDTAVAAGKPILHVHDALPEELPLAALAPWAPELSWLAPPGGEPMVASARGGLLRAAPDDLARLVEADAPSIRLLPGVDLEAVAAARVIDAPPIADRAPPSETELVVLEQLVCAPLLAAGVDDEPRAAGQLAAILGLEIVRLPDGAGVGRAAWALVGVAGRSWIMLGVRPGATRPLVLEAPRPRFELGTGRIAAELALAWDARALILDGERDRAHVAYASPTEPGAVATAFHALHQAAHRAVAGQPGAAVLAIRGKVDATPGDTSITLGIGPPVLARDDVPFALLDLAHSRELLVALASHVGWADGTSATTAYAGASSPQLLFSRAVGGADVALAFVSESVRRRFLPVDGAPVDERAAAAGLPRVDASIVDAALRVGRVVRVAAAGRKMPTAAPPLATALDLAEAAAASGDLVAYQGLARLVARTPGLAVGVGQAAGEGLPYLVVENGQDRAIALVGFAGARCVARPASDGAAGVRRDLLARCRTLVVLGVGAPP